MKKAFGTSYGPTTTTRYGVQVLSLTPLFKAWRAVWSTFPLDTVQKFIFSIELPVVEGGLTESRVYWGRHVPEGGGLAITEGLVSQAITELATLMSARSHRTAIYTLVGADGYRDMLGKAWKTLSRSFLLPATVDSSSTLPLSSDHLHKVKLQVDLELRTDALSTQIEEV
jgi:hypothetical protein